MTDREAVGRFHSAFALDQISQPLFCLRRGRGAIAVIHHITNMIYRYNIQRAIAFAIATHETHQHQKRKGKNMPYITHPLTTGIILAHAGANEDAIVAGILHDTIEDSAPGERVTKAQLATQFGKTVANIVASVTETNKNLPWENRKAEALARVERASHQTLLVKSADIISNASEIIEDHERDGDAVFSRFNAPKDAVLRQYMRMITAILKRWPENPLAEDLRSIAQDVQMIGAADFMVNNPAPIVPYVDYDENMALRCSVCGWNGTPKTSEGIEYYHDLFDVSCPICDKMLLVVSYPRA